MQSTSELVEQDEEGSETAAPHPEEMKASVHLQLGNLISLRATARATPAGIVSAALLLAALVGASAWVSRSRA
ncbi:MAG: hypothetical protein WDM85_15890 [Caulobacteraceae bacterium]